MGQENMGNMGTDIITRDQMLAEVHAACRTAELAGAEQWSINLIRAHFALPLIQVHPTAQPHAVEYRPDLLDLDRGYHNWLRDEIDRQRALGDGS